MLHDQRGITDIPWRTHNKDMKVGWCQRARVNASMLCGHTGRLQALFVCVCVCPWGRTRVCVCVDTYLYVWHAPSSCLPLHSPL